jgi:DNA-binding LacI/PurR family transcriptional regulator
LFVNGGSAQLDVTSVGVDERAAGRLATEHLLGLGHTRIGFAAGDALSSPTREKGEGREAALGAAGFEPDGLVAHTTFTVEGGRDAFRRLVSLPEPPTGIICSNDLMAIGVIREAEAHGLRVPGDLSVVGFDGIEAASWNEPPLTTVEQPIDEIAETAVRALRSLIENGSQSLPNYVFRPRLKLGRSTGPASAGR